MWNCGGGQRSASILGRCTGRPGARIEMMSGVDLHHNVISFLWRLVQVDGGFVGRGESVTRQPNGAGALRRRKPTILVNLPLSSTSPTSIDVSSVSHDVTPLDSLESLKSSTKQRERAQPVGSWLTPPVFFVPGWVDLKGDHQLLLSDFVDLQRSHFRIVSGAPLHPRNAVGSHRGQRVLTLLRAPVEPASGRSLATGRPRGCRSRRRL